MEITSSFRFVQSAHKNMQTHDKINVNYILLTRAEPIEPGTYTAKLFAENNINSVNKLLKEWPNSLEIGKGTKSAPITPESVLYSTTCGMKGGKIKGVTDKIQYKLAMGATDWTDIKTGATVIENLIAGTYQVRWKIDSAKDPHYTASEVKQVKIENKITSKGGKVNVTGFIFANSYLNISEIKSNNEEFKSMLSLIDTTTDEVIGALDIKIKSNNREGQLYAENLTVEFIVGEKHNGQKVTILHNKDGGNN